MPPHPRRKRRPGGRPGRIARGLGWFSIGIGVAQLLAPRVIARLAGVPVPPSFMMLCGAREIACGIGILTQSQPAPWMKLRVAGDALDLAGLAGGALLPGSEHRRIAAAAVAVAGVTALDAYCARELGGRAIDLPPRQQTLSIEIARDPATLYRFWRNPVNLPLVMPGVHAVSAIDDTRSRWVAIGRDGTRIEWDSEIIDDVAGERIAWRSLEGAAVFSAGSIQFRGTATGTTSVRLDLLYEHPRATVSTALAELVGLDPAGAPRADLEALKALLEREETTRTPPLTA